MRSSVFAAKSMPGPAVGSCDRIMEGHSDQQRVKQRRATVVLRNECRRGGDRDGDDAAWHRAPDRVELCLQHWGKTGHFGQEFALSK